MTANAHYRSFPVRVITQTDSVLRHRALFPATNHSALITHLDHIVDRDVLYRPSHFGLELLKRRKAQHIPALGFAWLPAARPSPVRQAGVVAIRQVQVR